MCLAPKVLALALLAYCLLTASAQQHGHAAGGAKPWHMSFTSRSACWVDSRQCRAAEIHKMEVSSCVIRLQHTSPCRMRSEAEYLPCLPCAPSTDLSPPTSSQRFFKCMPSPPSSLRSAAAARRGSPAPNPKPSCGTSPSQAASTLTTPESVGLCTATEYVPVCRTMSPVLTPRSSRCVLRSSAQVEASVQHIFEKRTATE